MPIVESTLRTGISAKLNAGLNPSGGMKVVGVSLGKVVDTADATKAFAVVEALAPCLTLSPVRVERTRVTLLEAE